MKKLFLVISSILISFFIIGAMPNQEKNLDSFNLLTTDLIEINNFIENGVRVEYSTKKNINKEYDFIKNKFIETFGENIKLTNNSIEYNDDLKEVKAVFWSKNDTSYIRIDYFNNNENIEVLEIRNILAEIINIKKEKVKYFDFIKLKIIEEEKDETKEIIKNYIVDKEFLEVENGIIGKGILKDNTKINIGYMQYDTGEYLIIGTPVIFVTY
ncbi:MAG: hypothetical protein GX258_03910 [Clostridiales bacterium]|nr:hypothetical protein [Clostridiales bacterium]